MLARLTQCKPEPSGVFVEPHARSRGERLNEPNLIHVGYVSFQARAKHGAQYSVMQSLPPHGSVGVRHS